MAYIRDDYCLTCQKETRHINTTCMVCQKLRDEEAEARWKALSVDEKIERLRKQIDFLSSQTVL